MVRADPPRDRTLMSLAEARPQAAAELTPAGLQRLSALGRRRWMFALCNLAVYVALAGMMASLLGAMGWSAINAAVFLAFLLVAPWSVLGLSNALLGLWLLHGARDGMAQVAPYARAAAPAPLNVRTAVVMTLRNEDCARAFARLRAIEASLALGGQGGAFDVFVLSDTSDASIAEAEEGAFARWRAGHSGASKLVYRRRDDNAGFKAGNVRDFCRRFGADYEFMLLLDADSLMAGETIVDLARMAQAHPRIGILQSLVVGAPARSAFARLFQFGMRHGMRPYAVGSAWWSGDCGQFWGHNALVRVKPFIEQCELPVLPGAPPLGGPILSHDQVEAALMRRAGYEVRVYPVETGSFEDNPPHLLEFCRRDQRWCAGNMQYFRLVGWPGLQPTSRFQLIWAIAMFVGLPALNLLLLLIALKAAGGAVIPEASIVLAQTLYWVFLLLMLLPKLAGFADVALTPGGLKRYGGAARFFASAGCELAFSFLTSAAVSFATAVFLLRLPFGGRALAWGGQSRDAQALSWSTAARHLWGPTLFGAALTALLAYGAPGLLPFAAPYVAGLALAIPLAVVSARPALGDWLARHRIGAAPEEFDPPPILRLLAAMEGKTP